MTNLIFQPFSKVPRLSREVVVTEKIDGTNASIYIGEDGEFLTGSRTRWITPENDNAGFSRWAHDHKECLLTLGPGHHFGEWWGKGIQRNYSLPMKKFSLFNTSRWGDALDRPWCCDVVPVLATLDKLDYWQIRKALNNLLYRGSYAAPGFMNPEGVVIYHKAGNLLFKMTEDDGPKGDQNVS